ncbi:MAG: FeoA family protein [Cytophagales bacterium]|nr:ferrous iron transport protein A [Hyphobacterium sp. CCMP332]
MKSLAQLSINEQGVIQSIAKSEFSNKLMEMGILPGSEVKMCSKAPFGGPVCVEVCGYCLSLRKKEAGLIIISE